MRRTPLRNHVAEENLAKQHTYLGLVAWKHKMFEKVGMVLVDNATGDQECLQNWLVKMEKLEQALSTKKDQTNDPDKKRDLQIMHAKVLVLKEQVTNISQPTTNKGTYSRGSYMDYNSDDLRSHIASTRAGMAATGSPIRNIGKTYRRNQLPYGDDELTDFD